MLHALPFIDMQHSKSPAGRAVRKALFLLLPFLISACYPDGAEYVDELDLVITVENPDANYSALSTYVIPDTIMFISNNENARLDEEVEQQILQQVNNRFQQNGWVASNAPASNGSDVLIAVSLLENVNLNIITGGWWNYWGGWPGWGYYPPFPPGGYYPGYPGYPGFCCYSGIYSYTTGTLIIEMVDPNEIPDETGSEPEPIPLLWAGAINGLLEGSDANLSSRLSRGLDQMFIDSPYLIKN